MEELKKLLAKEAPYQLSNEMMDAFCACMEEVKLERYDCIMKCGEINDNIYVVKEGIIRRAHQVGEKVITKSFAAKGSLIISWHCYLMNKPSVSIFEACCDSVVMRISKEKFDNLITTSHEFAQWALSIAHSTLFLQEFKTRVLKGSIKERYVSLIKSRPEIMRDVPLGFIASYLGITQSHFCRMRKELVTGK